FQRLLRVAEQRQRAAVHGGSEAAVEVGDQRRVGRGGHYPRCSEHQLHAEASRSSHAAGELFSMTLCAMRASLRGARLASNRPGRVNRAPMKNSLKVALAFAVAAAVGFAAGCGVDTRTAAPAQLAQKRDAI